MKRIIIICEGQTEQSFCNDVLQSHFNSLGLYIEHPTIKKTHGGIVNWTVLKQQIEQHLLEDNTAFVTTLIDYYGLHSKHQYPSWDEAEQNPNKNLRMDILEKGIFYAIKSDLQPRFIPYIQLHEFEGLLFSSQSVFDNNFEPDEFLDYNYLVETIRTNPNPELINNGNDTAPSKRLAKIINRYYKVLYGSLLAHDIGLLNIRNKCPRFNNWISKLETL